MHISMYAQQCIWLSPCMHSVMYTFFASMLCNTAINKATRFCGSVWSVLPLLHVKDLAAMLEICWQDPVHAFSHSAILLLSLCYLPLTTSNHSEPICLQLWCMPTLAYPAPLPPQFCTGHNFASFKLQRLQQKVLLTCKSLAGRDHPINLGGQKCIQE